MWFTEDSANSCIAGCITSPWVTGMKPFLEEFLVAWWKNSDPWHDTVDGAEILRFTKDDDDPIFHLGFIHPRWWQLKDFFHLETWGRWTHFDDHIFQMGWNHQPVMVQKSDEKTTCYLWNTHHEQWDLLLLHIWWSPDFWTINTMTNNCFRWIGPPS